MKQRVFLTGSTGYVGTKFSELYGSQFDILPVARAEAEHPIDLMAFEAVKKLFVDFKPDFVLHLAADIGRDSTTFNTITVTNPAITKNLIDLALIDNTPFLFTSTEAVYGGKENEGEYTETDEYKPRNPYGVSKVASEKLLMASGLPYLITRGHRHVGISKNFHRPKQFPDELHQLVDGQEIHLDSQKLFKPVLLNNVCDIFSHYMANDADKQVLVNIGVDRAVTFYDFMLDVAVILNLDKDLVKPDGEETGWPANSTLSLKKLHELGYPSVTYQEMLDTIKADSTKL
jgi:dTDP-4-dehydrorhamnose reductase